VSLTPHLFERLDPITGDEPFYVMTAFSILRDGDLDESNNYAERQYDELFPSQPLPADWRGWDRIAPEIAPHEAITERDGQYTKHGLGLPLLIAIPFDLFGRSGAVAVILAFAVALAGQCYLLARETGASPRLAATIALALTLTMPIVPYTHLLFPEVPAALCLLYAFRRVAAPGNTTLQWFLAGSAIGLMPWLHQRFAPTAVVFTIFIMFRFMRDRGTRSPLAALVPVGIGGVALIALNLWLFGAPIMPSENHDGFSGPAGTVNGTVGLLFDDKWGLLLAAPLMLLAIAAIPHWWRADRATARLAAFTILPYLATLATYSVWWGAWGPPARYLVPVVPLAAAPLAAWLSTAAWPGRATAIVCWLAGATLTLVGLIAPQRFYHQPNELNHLIGTLDTWLGTTVADHLVAFQTLDPSPTGHRIAAGLLGVALIAITVVLVSYTPRSRLRLARPVRSSPIREGSQPE